MDPIAGKGMTTFSQILDVHTELERLFAEHQYALLHFDLELAASLLRRYETLLLAHMRDEEDVLLPMYATHAEIRPAGGVKLMLDEHDKMRAHVTLFLENLERLKSETEREPLIIRLLDREAFYKRLASHHDNREREHLFPALDAIAMSEDERRAVIASLERPAWPGPTGRENENKAICTPNS
ncbi:MAG: hemerythrin domain-containing protein [Pyrinomonadaceae bacterium]